MSKSNQSSGAKQCMCDKCGATAISIAGKRHRNCPGQEGQPARSHDKRLPTADRGKWG
jgi:hypothetical protein